MWFCIRYTRCLVCFLLATQPKLNYSVWCKSRPKTNCTKSSPPLQAGDGNDFFLFSIFILEHIWWYRNERVHDGESGNLEDIVQNLKNMFVEFKSSLQHKYIVFSDISREPFISLWICLLKSFMMINIHAPMKKWIGFVWIVARNHYGVVIKVQNHKEVTDIPEVAKVFAICKDLLLARKDWWTFILRVMPKQWFKTWTIFQRSHCFRLKINRLAHLTCQWAAKRVIIECFNFDQIYSSFVDIMIRLKREVVTLALSLSMCNLENSYFKAKKIEFSIPLCLKFLQIFQLSIALYIYRLINVDNINLNVDNYAF